MIISASRRTDIPAYYSEWFFHRIRAGYCTVPNPYNSGQISRIALTPEHVDCIVFWTRNSQPLVARLPELDSLGYAYYFLYTLVDYPQAIEPAAGPLSQRIEAFCELSNYVGPDRVIWRYDPIIFGAGGGIHEHIERFSRLALGLHRYTKRVIISAYDAYPKTVRRLAAAAGPPQSGRRADSGLVKSAESGSPMPPEALDPRKHPDFGGFLSTLVSIAAEHGMQVSSCAERFDMRPYGIEPGACIDPVFIRQFLGRDVPARKDPAQRNACRCAPSRDIGMYDTCPAGCLYCYASGNPGEIRRRIRSHDPHGESLVPCTSKPGGDRQAPHNYELLL